MFETENTNHMKCNFWSSKGLGTQNGPTVMNMYDGSCDPENGNLNFWANSLKSIKMVPKIHWLGQVPMLLRIFFQFPLASHGLPRHSRACGPSSSKEFITRLPSYWAFQAHSRFPTKTSQNINNLLCIRTLRNKRTHYTGFACSKSGLSHYQSEQQCDDLFLNIWSLPPTIAAQSQTIKFIVPWICLSCSTVWEPPYNCTLEQQDFNTKPSIESNKQLLAQSGQMKQWFRSNEHKKHNFLMNQTWSNINQKKRPPHGRVHESPTTRDGLTM